MAPSLIRCTGKAFDLYESRGKGWPSLPAHVIDLKYNHQIMSRIITTISVAREDPAGPDLIRNQYKSGRNQKVSTRS